MLIPHQPGEQDRQSLPVGHCPTSACFTNYAQQAQFGAAKSVMSTCDVIDSRLQEMVEDAHMRYRMPQVGEVGCQYLGWTEVRIAHDGEHYPAAGQTHFCGAMGLSTLVSKRCLPPMLTGPHRLEQGQMQYRPPDM